MNNKTKVGMGVVLGAVAGIAIGIITKNIGSWIGIGIVLGGTIGLVITRRF